MPTHSNTNRFRSVSLYLLQKTGMGTVRHASGTRLTLDYLSEGCKAGVGKHISTLTERANFSLQIVSNLCVNPACSREQHFHQLFCPFQ